MMADWLVSLPFFGLGALLLALGLVLLPAMQGPWPWLLPLFALALQAAQSGADALGVGLVLGLALTSALFALAATPDPNTQPPSCREIGLARRTVGRAMPNLWLLVERASIPWLGLLFASAAATLMALDGRIARWEGALLGTAGFGALLACRWQASPWPRSGNSVAHLATLVRHLPRLVAALTLVGAGARLILIGALDLGLVLDLGTHAIGLALGAGMGLVGWDGQVRNMQPTNGIGWSGVRTAYFTATLALTGVLGLAALSTPGGLACRQVPPAAWWILTAVGVIVWIAYNGPCDEERCV
ncbi:hypothetical protein GWK36_06710 [Caldichromatium japonicum]|uniref:Uncharacterized protein n=1 Tax=Caldichromatium japonicum TaxID=2699430 RepID=A0A6G7VD61_9GAMM|nr:hypothetical protein [Caldichromatium japonicum]QIK37727.1 hypothetical protein GWK36_06710 [Caldichromatium japonicum]